MTRYKTIALAAIVAVLAACTPAEERAANYLTRAQTLFEEGNLTRAKLEARNAAQIEPRNAEARFLLAQIAEREQEVRPMIQNLMIAVDADPNHVQARLKLGNLMFFGQAYDQSFEQLQALLELDPGNAEVVILEGRHKAQQGDFAAALERFERATQIDPGNSEAIILRAASYAESDVDLSLSILDEGIARLSAERAKPLREIRVLILGQAGRTDQVEQEFRALLRDFPDEQRFQQQLAGFFAQQGRMDEADEVLRTVAERDPGEVNPRLTYVGFLATQRSVEDAEATLKAFIEETPDKLELRLALSEIYEATGRLDDARGVYEELARLAPRGSEGLIARNRLAALDVQAGNMDAGRQRIEGILRDVPDNAQALLLRAALSFNENRFQDAIADLRIVLRREEADQRALLLLAQSYVRSGEMVLARDSYRRLLEVNPTHGEGLMQLAAIFASEGDLQAAQPLLQRRTEAAPNDIVAAGRHAEALIQLGEFDAAEAEARRLTAIEGSQGLGEFQLGRVFQARSQFAEAIPYFRVAYEQRPADPPALESLVNVKSAAGRNAENITLLNRHLEENPDHVHARFLLAATHARGGDTARAEQYLEQVIAERPQVPIAWASLASLYPGQEGAAQRKAVYRRGLEAIPANTDLGMLLGTELEIAGRYDEAIALYEDLVAVHPDYDPAVNNLAALLLDHRSDEESHTRALALARRFAASDNAAMIDTLGWAYYRTGQYTQAVGLLERAVSRRGDVPVLRYHLGMTYLAMGNEVGARQQLSEALAREDVQFPGVEEARETLERLL
ncbi:MAG: tetratricopeptide repeat protein [Chromatiales bacterium]|nr:tetratricopeptide repeat protein [Chromatiales bacterium]